MPFQPKGYFVLQQINLGKKMGRIFGLFVPYDIFPNLNCLKNKVAYGETI